MNKTCALHYAQRPYRTLGAVKFECRLEDSGNPSPVPALNYTKLKPNPDTAPLYMSPTHCAQECLK